MFNDNRCSLLKGKYLLFQWVWKYFSLTFSRTAQSPSEVLGTQRNRHQRHPLWTRGSTVSSISSYTHLFVTDLTLRHIPTTRLWSSERRSSDWNHKHTCNRISSLPTHPAPKSHSNASNRTAAWRRLLPIPSSVRSGILMETVWCKRKKLFSLSSSILFPPFSHSVTVHLFLFAATW